MIQIYCDDEYGINKFIKENPELEIIDIKMSLNDDVYGCMVIYRDKSINLQNEGMIDDIKYPKVVDFVSHIITRTNLVILDGITEDLCYFEGTVNEYFNSTVKCKNLLLNRTYIKNNTLYVIASLNQQL